MIELKTYVIQEMREGTFIEVSDSEYEFLLSLLKVSGQQDLLKPKYIFDGNEGLQLMINNIYIPPVVRRGSD